MITNPNLAQAHEAFSQAKPYKSKLRWDAA